YRISVDPLDAERTTNSLSEPGPEVGIHHGSPAVLPPVLQQRKGSDRGPLFSSSSLSLHTSAVSPPLGPVPRGQRQSSVSSATSLQPALDCVSICLTGCSDVTQDNYIIDQGSQLPWRNMQSAGVPLPFTTHIDGLLLSDSDGACAVWEGESQLFMSPPVPVL
ncbi:Alphaalpha-trehalose-phosphate synthase [UDP-forming] 5, partial [Dissostichus eleginoides]